MAWFYYGILAGLIFGFYDVLTKQALRVNSVLTVVFVGSVVGALLWSPIYLLRDRPSGAGWPSFALEQILILPKSLAMVVSWVFAYYAVKNLPITISSAVRASGPVMTLIGSMIFLNQWLTPMEALGFAIAVLGYFGFSAIGRREAIEFSNNRWVFCMLIATAASAAVAVYDRWLVASRELSVLYLQADSAIQRALLISLLYWVYQRRRSGEERAALHWSLLAVGAAWVVAEAVYFVAVADPAAVVPIISVLRRTGIAVSFCAAAFVFDEVNLRMKTAALAVLFTGVAILILASQ